MARGEMTKGRLDTSERQEVLDTFYHRNGPCCAGCDWWRSLNSCAGECTRGPKVSGHDRMLACGIDCCSLAWGSGHVITARGHVCGEFRDNFDWTSLPLRYRVRVGDPTVRRRSAGRIALGLAQAQEGGE